MSASPVATGIFLAVYTGAPPPTSLSIRRLVSTIKTLFSDMPFFLFCNTNWLVHFLQVRSHVLFEGLI